MRVVRSVSARVTPYLPKQSIQMDILRLVLELPMKTVGIYFLRVRCGEIDLLMYVDKRKNDVMAINVQ